MTAARPIVISAPVARGFARRRLSCEIAMMALKWIRDFLKVDASPGLESILFWTMLLLEISDI